MFGWGPYYTGFWWVIPLFFFLFMCFFMIRGCGCMSAPRNRRPMEGSQESAEEILKRRYALGEIDEERFAEMRRNLVDKNAKGGDCR